MSLSAASEAAFNNSAGVSLAEIKILIASIFISFIFIFVMVILRGSFRSWSKEYIDVGELFARALALGFVILIAVYLAN